MSSYDIKLEELDETFPVAEHPENVKVRMWPHQLALYNRCKQFENQKIALSEFSSLNQNHTNLTPNDYMRTQVGIIGDRVGSGKSFVVLALVMNNDINNMDSTVKSYANNKVVFCFSERNINIKTNLLVVPHNLVSQWETYVRDFSDNIRYLVVSKMKHVEEMYENEAAVPTYDLIIVTATCYARVAHFLTSRSFKMQRVIYDEVDNMNLPNCVAIDSNFYWFVTASYGNVLFPRGYCKWDYSLGRSVWYATGLRNSGFVKDLFMNLFNNLSKDYVKIMIIKNKDDFIQSSVSLPEIINNYVKCKTPLEINMLDGFVDREVIQSLNAGDVLSALQRISPSHRNTEDNLVAIQIERYSRELHNYEIRLEFTQTLEFTTDAERDAELARLRKRRDEFAQKIEGINNRIRNSNTCCICYDDLNNKSIAPCCSNAFCFLCINIWLVKQACCPLCKQTLLGKDLLVVDENAGDVATDATHYQELPDDEVSDQFDKLKNLEVILKKIGTTGKVLIYSSYDMSFSSVTNILDNLQIRYAYLKGNEHHIKKTLERYKQENLSVLLVNTRNYGSGLNLENTTDIIMFHKVESETEKQVLGRAQRYGRTCPLKVHYLLYDNEIR